MLHANTPTEKRETKHNLNFRVIITVIYLRMNNNNYINIEYRYVFPILKISVLRKQMVLF